jgi:transposase
MTPEMTLLTAALGLQAPWRVSDVRLDTEASRIDIRVEFATGRRFACPSCGAVDQRVHDTRERSWQHLHFFQHRAYLPAPVPCVRCEHCEKTTQVVVLWSRPQSGFTQLFEAMVLMLCRQMPVNAIARMLCDGDDALWRVLRYHVDKAHAAEDFIDVEAIGIDETAAKRRQDYITLFHDLKKKRLLFGCGGRKQSTVKEFFDDLTAYGGSPEQIHAACIDMSKPSIAGVTRYLPNVEITFDKFHIVQFVNAMVDDGRRQEMRVEPILKNTRWAWIKDAGKHTWRQLNTLHQLTRTRLKTARAWRLKEALRDLLSESMSREETEYRLNRWYSWARGNRLEPFKKLALTIKSHWQGILNSFDSSLTNGYIKGVNSLLQAAKARARGYRKERCITMAYLVAGELSQIPALSYGHAKAKSGSEWTCPYPHDIGKNRKGYLSHI